MKLTEECGVFGVYNCENASQVTFEGLLALQHRGQEGAGIAVRNEDAVVYHKGPGLLSEVFDNLTINTLQGNTAIGHVLYTKGKSRLKEDIGPLVTKYVKGTLSVAHNGALLNAELLREELENNGAIFQTTSDMEIIAYIVARERVKAKSIEHAVEIAMYSLKGVYSSIIMSPQKLIGFRDPTGIRPLCLGQFSDNSYVLASESCALDTVNAKFIRDIKPGEIVVIDENGVNSILTHVKEKSNICIFEHIYFARPDSEIEGKSIYESRKTAGKLLAQRDTVQADLVMGVPDSGIDAAIGYAEYSGIPYAEGLLKNRYVGRTFIKPTQKLREDAVRLKLNTINSVLNGKDIILIDDSIVRGTTSKRIIKLLRNSGVNKIHLRISSPPFKHLCYFGTDIPSTDELIACKYTPKEINEMLDTDTLDFLTYEDLKKIMNCSDFCAGCFTGEYPMPVSAKQQDKFLRQTISNK